MTPTELHTEDHGRVVHATGPGLSSADARRYAGRWVALRDGKVVASGRSRRRVERDPRVRDGDAVYRVPDADTLIV